MLKGLLSLVAFTVTLTYGILLLFYALRRLTKLQIKVTDKELFEIIVWIFSLLISILITFNYELPIIYSVTLIVFPMIVRYIWYLQQ